MGPRRFLINIRILFPFIVGGLVLLAFVVGVQAGHLSPGVRGSIWPLILWASALTVTGAGLTALVTFLALRPMERFVRTAQARLARMNSRDKPVSSPGNEFSHYHQVFQQVEEILDLVDSRAMFSDFVGHSEVMRAVFGRIVKVASTESTVLLTGESGTGKELAATSIHRLSPRAEGPLVKLNCISIPTDLLESELFGHEKGAFTGATARRTGRFEAASGGTLFLDEIGDMPMATQGKLLRVLQEMEFERVGGNETIRVDVRIIAATNKNLETMVRDSAFREDLFYRLNIFPIHMPELRRRREDIPPLTEFFLSRTQGNQGISEEAMRLLIAHSWPGNVRELKNVLERSSILAAGRSIEPEHLPPEISGGIPADHGDEEPRESNLDTHLWHVERSLIVRALEQAGGVQAKAAEILGIKPRSLWHRVKKFEIDVDRYKR
ncbi:MAG: sigma-54-dependent Fis family transcriptional regulator [Deltaproteobacteria bacterium]|nr:sigma-54-dependent Fis family transcriptional regulator [Deltaproteobacteria bacterium]